MPKIDRTGETNMSTCGQMMTIIRYGGSTDIDVQFEDGTIVTNKMYCNFLKGYIMHPGYMKSKLGEVSISGCGQKITIIKYVNYMDIDVMFEDGTVVEHKRYDAFKKGCIKNPNYHNKKARKSPPKKIDRCGETHMSSCGQMMKIIRYGKADDIDVQFEDGTIVKNRTYYSFKIGSIENPNCKVARQTTPIRRIDRIGETVTSKCGQKMSIIKYNNAFDINVQFEDGTVVQNSRYAAFKRGSINNPNFKNAVRKRQPKDDEKRRVSKKQKSQKVQKSKERLNQRGLSSCGLIMTIIAYNNSGCVDVQFEDGVIVKNKTYSSFISGKIEHPKLSARRKSIYKNIVAKYAWRENDKVYYKCRCQKCNEENIWTPQEMISHEQECKKEG